MSRRLKLTKHSSLRYEERTNVEKRDYEKNGKTARSKGLRFEEVDFKEKKIFNYLKPTSWNAVKKYYNGFIYVFSKNKRKLITVYKVENEEMKNRLEEIWRERRKIK